MSETAQELQKQLIEKTAQSFLLSGQIEKIRKKLAPICDHPNPEDWEWEHDNGYGRQTKMTGKRCSFCYKKDYWSRGQWTNE